MRIRGKWREIEIGSVKVRAIATLHPAYLLRAPAAKRLVWRDLLAVRGRPRRLANGALLGGGDASRSDNSQANSGGTLKTTATCVAYGPLSQLGSIEGVVRVTYRYIRPMTVVYARSMGPYETSCREAWRPDERLARPPRGALAREAGLRLLPRQSED